MAIFIFEYTSLWKYILLYFLSILLHSIATEKKIVGQKVRITSPSRRKTKCFKVSVIGKKMIFQYFWVAWLIIT